MSNKKEYDEIVYFGYFKKLYESWEESTNKMMDVWMNSPLMERAVEKSSEFKNYIHNFIDQSLEKRYIPQKVDIDRLIDTIESLEEKVSELEMKIEKIQSSPRKSTPKPRTAGTRKKVKEKKQ
ncbi:MAG: hypothetical protein RIG61_01800 [Deltaproteobacteria bacterium]